MFRLEILRNVCDVLECSRVEAVVFRREVEVFRYHRDDNDDDGKEEEEEEEE